MSPRRARRRTDDVVPLRTDAIPTLEQHDGDDWVVRPVAAGRAAKPYRCPGCDQEIAPATPHVVVWPVGREDERRHWHRPCWAARGRRGVKVHRSKNAPRHG